MEPEHLRWAITKKTKALILNSSSNPTGTAYTESELRAITNIIVEKGIYVISDEIYEKIFEKIFYDGFEHVSIGSFLDEIKEKTGFDLKVAPDAAETPVPDQDVIALIHRIDPDDVRLSEFR